MRSLGLVDFGAANPRRPVDWRWRKASYLLDRGFRWSRCRDDELTRRAKHYMSALSRCRCVADRGRLERKLPAVAAAIALHEGEPTARLAVEAGLLAGEPIEAVARRCGVPVEAAEVYEQLFFNVADRLENTSYVLFCAIGPATYEGFDLDDPGPVLKWFAYLGGPQVLDFLLGTGEAPGGPVPAEGHAIRPDEAVRSARLRRIALAAKAVAINQSSATRLIRLCAFQQELLGTSSAGAREVLSAGLDSMLGSLTRSHADEVLGSVGTDRGDRHDPSEVTPDSVIADDPYGIDLLKFTEVVAATLGEEAPESRITGARRGA
jgi:hypothetical protein